jgi:hypothetical protein
MIPYWIMFLLPAGAALLEGSSKMRRINGGWIALWIILTLLIGYRFEVGGDWGNYLRIYYDTFYVSLTEALSIGDPGHSLLNWISSQNEWGVFGVNLIYGAIFSYGLIAFCRNQQRPILTLAVAVPYLVIVVAMGYSRQGVAIGIIMLGFIALAQRKTLNFVLLIGIAALFHKSAVILLPLSIMTNMMRKPIFTALWVGGTMGLMYLLFLAESADSLIENYIVAEMDSEGAQIRVTMNALPALLFLWYRQNFNLQPEEKALWTWMSVMALMFVLLLAVSSSSTAVDRVALYFIPIQLYVFSRLPDVIASGLHRKAICFLVVSYYAAVLFVWLNYAGHSNYWIPYQFYPFVN